MSGILEFFSYAYVLELAGIDAGEKCLGPGTWHGTKGGIWDVGCDYGVTIGKSGAGFLKGRDPCVAHCGIWQRVKRLIGRFKVRGKFEIHMPSGLGAWRGTAFTINVSDDGTTLVVVLEGEVEVIDKTYLHSIIVKERQQITAIPQKTIAEPCAASEDLLSELKKWKANIINEEENIEEFEMPKNTVIELPKGRLNYASSGSEKGG